MTPPATWDRTWWLERKEWREKRDKTTCSTSVNELYSYRARGVFKPSCIKASNQMLPTPNRNTPLFATTFYAPCHFSICYALIEHRSLELSLETGIKQTFYLLMMRMTWRYLCHLIDMVVTPPICNSGILSPDNPSFIILHLDCLRIHPFVWLLKGVYIHVIPFTIGS